MYKIYKSLPFSLYFEFDVKSSLLIVGDEALVGFVKTEVEGAFGNGRQLKLDVNFDVNNCLLNGDEAETGKWRNVFVFFLLGSGEYLFVEHLFLGFDIY